MTGNPLHSFGRILLLAAFLVPCASAGETARSIIFETAPERFHVAFSLRGTGRVILISGTRTISFSDGSAAPADLRLPLRQDKSSVECYGNHGRIDVFVNDSYSGTVNVPDAAHFPFAIEAAGAVSVENVRSTTLPDVFFRDDFMRAGRERDAWQSSGTGLSLAGGRVPAKSASPFRMESTSSSPGEIRTGNHLWRDYSAAAAFLLAGDGACAALGIHLRGDRGLWAELTSGNRFVVTSGLPAGGRIVLDTAAPFLPGEWHEIALSPSEAALDGTVFPLRDVPPLPGGETAVRLAGKGSCVDDVRIESSHPGLVAFLTSFWSEPGDIREAFQRDAEMTEWARGRFTWTLRDGREAVYRFPVFGPRGITLGAWRGASARLSAIPAAGAEFTVSLSPAGVDVTGRILENRASASLSRSDEATLMARSDGLYVNGRKILPSPDGWKPRGIPEASLVEGSWPNLVRVQADSARDFAFSRAPAGFVPVSGSWRVMSRWRCAPEYTWYSGNGDPAHIVYRYPLRGTSSIALAFAPGMRARATPFYNWPMGCVVALSPDPLDPFAGVAYIAQGLTGPGLLYVNGHKKGEDTTLSDGTDPVAAVQSRFSRIHHRWDIIRMSRRGDHVEVKLDDGGLLAANDEVIPSCAYLHILCPSKSLAVISRLYLSAEEIGAPEPQKWRRAIPPGGTASLTVNGAPLPVVPAPDDGKWAFAFRKTPGPDGLSQSGKSVVVTMNRPAVRWAAGVRLHEPVRLTAMKFTVRGGEEMRPALYLDTDIGPVRIAIRRAAPIAPCIDLEPARPQRDGSVDYDFSAAWKWLGGAPVVSGIYVGELDRSPEDVYGMLSHVSGRSLELGPLQLACAPDMPSALAPQPPDESLLFLTSPIEIVRDGDVLCTVDSPLLERLRLGAAPISALGPGSSFGYADGAALVRRQWQKDVLYAVNPVTGGPAGIWVHDGALSTRRIPFLALRAGDETPPVAWDLIAGTAGGKRCLSWKDNKNRFHTAGRADLFDKGPGQWWLFDLDRLSNDMEPLTGLVLADGQFYSSCENSTIRIDDAAWGLRLAADESIRIKGLQGPLRYELLDLQANLLEEGTSSSGLVRPRTVRPEGSPYILRLSRMGASRLAPIKLEKSIEGPHVPLKDWPAAGTEPSAVLISDGVVSTFFRKGDAPVPLLSNRRGSFATDNPPAGWSEPNARSLDRLAGGLLVEMLDKPHEGFYLVSQDSGLAGRDRILRFAIAMPKGSWARIVRMNDDYVPIAHEGLPAGQGDYVQVEKLLDQSTDSVYAEPGDTPFLLRAMSVSDPAERNMRLAFFNIPDGAECGWRSDGPGVSSPQQWLPPRVTEARFRIDGPHGNYKIIPCLRRENSVTTLRPIDVRVQ
ncbi:MAG: hypothetical protein JW909_01410 [Planctomycetes bacterium]|nr:hypothetical protein [Planctomycetota bacterium]